MTTSISLHSIVTVTKEQVSCDLSGETVVLNLANGQYFGLNAVAARIWEMLQEECSVRDVRDRLLTTYPDAEPERCTSDLLNVLAELAEADLIRIAAGAARAPAAPVIHGGERERNDDPGRT